MYAVANDTGDGKQTLKGLKLRFKVVNLVCLAKSYVFANPARKNIITIRITFPCKVQGKYAGTNFET